jgi:putative membrane protein
MKKSFSLILKGMAMGIAETIPGVSGGTIAFISGIYEELLESIKAFNPKLIQILKNEGMSGAWKAIHGKFLITLLVGMVLGLAVGIVFIEWMLEAYPPVIWAFFFGLILASIYYVGKQISKKNLATFLAFTAGAVVAFSLTQLPVGNPNENLLFVFISGAIAVSALILPGISGSFILLLMGMYTFILHDTLKNQLIIEHSASALLIMVVFGLGMVLGLASISRFLSWAFKKFKDITLAVLTGFMLGAIMKLWPWRIPEMILNGEDETVAFSKGMEVDKVILDYASTPANYETVLGQSPFVLASIITCLLGVALVLLMDAYQTKLHRT